MLKNYVETIEDLVGKTIENVRTVGSRLYLRFTDGTWTGVEPSFDPIDGDVDSTTLVNKNHITIYDQHNADIITDEELQVLVKKEQASYKRARQRQDRQTYERLKAQFEKMSKFYDKADFGNYHWAKGFYEKIVETLGQEKVDALQDEMFQAWEKRHDENKIMLEKSGWMEVERGIYVGGMKKEEWKEYGCEIHMESSRVCQKGTKCCTVNHNE